MTIIDTLVKSLSLLSALPQTATNGITFVISHPLPPQKRTSKLIWKLGNSQLGTLNAPPVADFLTNNVCLRGPGSKSQAYSCSLCLKASPGVPGQQQQPTHMSSHLPPVRLRFSLEL